MGSFRDRGYIKLPLIKFNWARRGLRFHFTSHSWHLGPWSWNSRTKKHRVDHPGGGWWESRSKRRHK